MFFLEIFYPKNLPFTILLIVVLIYWITNLLGLLDLDDFEIDFPDNLSIINLGAVPLSIWFSIFIFILWVSSLTINSLFDLLAFIAIPLIVRYLVILLVFVPLSGFVTKLITTPLKKIFVIKNVSKTEFIGKEAVVTTTAVDENFGLCELKIDGIPHILDIRAKKEAGIKKDDHVILYKYDKEQDIYFVTHLEI